MRKNGVMMQYFEWNLPNDGQLWNRLKEDAAHLSDIGVSSVWIPPAYKADEQQDEGYATYDLYDLGEFDQKGTVRTKYGTRQELLSAIEELHNNHIAVYLDAVMNHKTGADFTEKFMAVEVDPNNREKPKSDPYEIEAWTGFNFPGRNKKYSDFEWHWYHFSGVDYNQANGKNAIYEIVGEGKGWAPGVDGENVNYDFLMMDDVDFNHPEVRVEVKKWGAWVAKELNLDGMRLDAIKHISNEFIQNFVETVRAAKDSEFYFVGEYWKDDRGAMDYYLNSVKHELDLFDVPLHYNLHQASEQGRDYDLRKLFDGALVSTHPQLAVPFVDNHDSQRGSSLESQIKSWFKPLAYGLILLMKEGYPCIFYEISAWVKGESLHAKIIDILLDARKKYAYGDQDSYFDHGNVIGFVRRGDGNLPGSGLAFLMSTGDNGEKTMFVGEERKGQVWHEITGNIKDEVTIGDDGKAVFKVSGGNLAVWVQKEDK